MLRLAESAACSHPAIRSHQAWNTPFIATLRGKPIMDARSSWSCLFDTDDDTIARVACELSDGSWIDGWIWDWNTQPEEDGDRTLILHAPLRVRPKGRETTTYLQGIAYSIIADGQIVRIDVTHVERQNRISFDADYTANGHQVELREPVQSIEYLHLSERNDNALSSASAGLSRTSDGGHSASSDANQIDRVEQECTFRKTWH